jgi:hypothetical protein
MVPIGGAGTAPAGRVGRVGVEVRVLVEVELGMGVMEGVRARSWVTCAYTVEATSVRNGFMSMVGVAVGVELPQADNHGRLKNAPIRTTIFSLRAILLLLWYGGRRCRPLDGSAQVTQANYTFLQPGKTTCLRNLGVIYLSLDYWYIMLIRTIYI